MEKIEGIMRPILHDVYGKEFPFEVNMLQHVIDHANCYGIHNDCHPIHNIVDDEEKYKTLTHGCKLPSWEQTSITVTICLESRRGEDGV